MIRRNIAVFGAAEHNLKGFDLAIPRGTLTVITGVSGSGKSSLAFDTIYAEGQRRYVESLSSYARQFLDQMPRPHVDHIEGLSPAISIEQKTTGRNPRSTVGTVTEVYDFLRLLFAYVGRAHCPKCGAVLERQSAASIAAQIDAMPSGTRVMIMAPVVRGRKGEHAPVFETALRAGFERVKLNGELQLIEPGMKLSRNYKHDISIVLDRVVAGSPDRERNLQSIEKALALADRMVTLEIVPGRDGKLPRNVPWEGERTFSEAIGCPTHGPQIMELTPRMFSFNSRFGWCEQCEGIGTITEVDMDRLVTDPNASIEDGALAPWAQLFAAKKKGRNPQMINAADRVLEQLRRIKVPSDVPWKKIKKSQRDYLLFGDGETKPGMVHFTGGWDGLVHRLRRDLDIAEEHDLESAAIEYVREVPCPSCEGARLRPESLAVSLLGKSIAQVCTLSIGELGGLLGQLTFTVREEKIARAPLREILDRVQFLEKVGLGYLNLHRGFGTLSGGEAQRVRLATQIGTRLTGVLYILDEPSIGLHQRDNELLIRSLHELRDLGNTVLVVEHDEQTIRSSDFVVDLGPGAGRLGGELVAAGTPEMVARDPKSLTGKYLTGEIAITPPAVRRQPSDAWLSINACRQHNLRGVTMRLPLGLLVGVGGVSGAGKSSLIIETLLPLLSNEYFHTHHPVGPHGDVEGIELLDKVIHVDQAPIGRTPRSNPATYTKVFDAIRDLFANTEEARLRGYAKGRFSFNVRGGRCEECEGAGARKIEMQFLPDVLVECESCHGARYNRDTLEVHYRGRTIAEVLAMTVEDACVHFAEVPQIARHLETMRDVGLGYVTLGQSATTLSGGEAQRIKLGRELAKKNTGRTMYILDEPTTGLHFEDVRKLIEVLQQLVGQGSTVVVIEHNLDVLKCCDWLLDLGPEGGEFGGEIIAQGTPETVAAHGKSHTGRFLKELLAAKHIIGGKRSRKK